MQRRAPLGFLLATCSLAFGACGGEVAGPPADGTTFGAESNVNAVALSHGEIYWTVADTAGMKLYRASSTGGDAELVDADLLLVLEQRGDAALWCRPDPPSVARLQCRSAVGTGTPISVPYDLSDGAATYAIDGKFRLVRTDVATNDKLTLATGVDRLGPSTVSASIALDDASVYFFVGSEPSLTLERVPKTGGDPVVVATNVPRADRLLRLGDALYWFEGEGTCVSDLVTVPLAGGTPRVVGKANGVVVFAVALEGKGLAWNESCAGGGLGDGLGYYDLATSRTSHFADGPAMSPALDENAAAWVKADGTLVPIGQSWVGVGHRALKTL